MTLVAVLLVVALAGGGSFPADGSEACKRLVNKHIGPRYGRFMYPLTT